MVGNKGKLSKLNMPSKKKPLDDVAVMELEMEPESDSSDDSDVSDAEEGDSADADAESSDADTVPLADASDDELLAEVRKRGLSDRAEKASGDEPTSDDEY